ncbi:prepilin peptidase, partial [Candidatus Poribacteria bacterium]|nr:prepilin peptidase [Candidatus Poribacteria bacterium]
GCCLYASITDLKERRIRNFCSLGLLYCGFILQVIFWLQGWIPLFYLISVTLGGAVLAYLSYIFNFFAPGDAKLFWAVCVALPPLLFKSPKGYMFAPIVLLLVIGVYQAIIFWAHSKGVEILVLLLGTLAYLVTFFHPNRHLCGYLCAHEVSDLLLDEFSTRGRGGNKGYEGRDYCQP